MTTDRTSRYRSKSSRSDVIGLSISYQREHLLARGFGLEHLRELLIRLARPLLRQRADLAYGGHWGETDDNFTFDLLRLISAEQQDNRFGGPDTALKIGQLYNHCRWPEYLDITPRIEAQWIHCCRIVRISQEMAGIPPADVVPDSEARRGSDHAFFNAAVCLSAMRRLMMNWINLPIPGLASPFSVPPVTARIVLGGKVDGFSGFLPGIFEEALVTLESGRPLYLLGGFGGAAAVLANALLTKGTARPPELTTKWQAANTPNVAKLDKLRTKYKVPPGVRSTSAALDALFAFVKKGRRNLAKTLGTGLDEAQTRELLATQDLSRAVKLVHMGLRTKFSFDELPA